MRHKFTQDNLFTGHGERRCRIPRQFHVIGNQSGPVILSVHASWTEAVEEYAVRHCKPVDMHMSDEEFDGLLEAGEIRVAYGDSPYYPDPDMWVRGFASFSEARKFWRECGRAMPAYD